MLVYFAAFKKHIGMFPPVTGDDKLKEEASVYARPKGNLQFPLDQPISYGLIRKIVKARQGRRSARGSEGKEGKEGQAQSEANQEFALIGRQSPCFCSS
jgi:hypothetical protein